HCPHGVTHPGDYRNVPCPRATLLSFLQREPTRDQKGGGHVDLRRDGLRPSRDAGLIPMNAAPQVGADDGTRAVSASKPTIVIVPGSTPLGQYARDLWHHRDLIRVLALRELTLRYRQTLLGAIWVVLQPLLAAGLLSFVFGRVANLPTDGVPSFLFTYAGMLG